MRVKWLVLLCFVPVLFLAQSYSEAGTILVPGDYKDVGKALDEASYGDTVLVSPGRYRVQASVRNGVAVLSTDGPDSTVLWNQRWHILKLSDCDMATRISGFTFDGKGCNICLACTTGAPTIEGNVIKDSWDGINMYRCNALVKDNTITGCNRGLHLDYSDPEITRNDIRKNGDAISLISSSPMITSCTLDRNGRALLILGHSYPTIGGSLSAANNILSNGYTVYNAGLRIDGSQFTDQREMAVATYNYWGSDCPDEKKFRGEVHYRPWTNAEHDTLFEQCPKETPPQEDESG